MTVVTWLSVLSIISTVTSQNFNPLGNYAPLGTGFEGVNRPYYGYFGGDSSYYSQGYAPTYTSPGIDQFFGTFSNSPQRGGFSPFNQGLPPREFTNTPYPNSQYQPNVYPGMIYNRPFYSNYPQGPFSSSSPQFENYAPTFTTPLGPLQGPNSIYYNPALSLPASNSPNIIREDADGKSMRETNTSSINGTFEPIFPSSLSQTLEGVAPPNYPFVTNGGNIPQYYPETNLRTQSYGPDFSPASAENIQTALNLPGDPSQNLGNTPVPNPSLYPTGPIPSYTNPSVQFSNGASQNPGNTDVPNPSPYPTGPIPYYANPPPQFSNDPSQNLGNAPQAIPSYTNRPPQFINDQSISNPSPYAEGPIPSYINPSEQFPNDPRQSLGNIPVPSPSLNSERQIPSYINPSEQFPNDPRQRIGNIPVPSLSLNSERPTPSYINPSEQFPNDPIQSLGNIPVPSPSLNSEGTITSYANPPDQISNNRKEAVGNNPISSPRTPVYPTELSPVLPDISLGGSPRNLGDQSFSFNSEPDASSRFGGFTSPGLQQPPVNLRRLPSSSYEAPGREEAP